MARRWTVQTRDAESGRWWISSSCEEDETRALMVMLGDLYRMKDSGHAVAIVWCDPDTERWSGMAPG